MVPAMALPYVHCADYCAMAAHGERGPDCGSDHSPLPNCCLEAKNFGHMLPGSTVPFPKSELNRHTETSARVGECRSLHRAKLRLRMGGHPEPPVYLRYGVMLH